MAIISADWKGYIMKTSFKKEFFTMSPIGFLVLQKPMSNICSIAALQKEFLMPSTVNEWLEFNVVAIGNNE